MEHTTGYAVFMDENALPKSLVDALHQLGAHKVDTHGQSSDFIPLKSPTYWIVIVDAENPVSPDYIKAHITLVPQQTATLLVLVGNPQAWPEQFTHCCHDFVRWPCSQAELQIRLARLGQAPKPITPAPDKTAQLMKQVANLNLVGQSAPFTQSLDLIQKFAACDAPVFIDGETGTGKELAARAIHYMSERRDNAFVAINCGALPDSLIECESTITSHKGLTGEAQGGTLFLNEIDALSSKNQVALLRLLQDLTFRPDDSTNEQNPDVRIVVATNQIAKELPNNGDFRKDLFYRLYILAITLPPLRQRREDIHLLAHHFIKNFNQKYQREKVVTANFISWMEQQNWEGNVRELENFLHRNYLMSDGELIVLPNTSSKDKVDTQLNFNDAKHQLIEQFEKNYLTQLLSETQGNVSEAARRAGKERRALGKLIKKHSIDVDGFRTTEHSY